MDGRFDFNRDELDEDCSGETLPPVIGGNERRMHVRAHEYWASLLNGRECPAIQELDPASISDFGPHSVLLDFSHGIENPRVAYLGRALREECGILAGIRTVADVPPRSLLSRLTDHSLEIIANKAPIGFEAEFSNHSGQPTFYRGILLPFTSDGDGIDYVYGVINWKHSASDLLSSKLEQDFAAALTWPSPLASKMSPWPEPVAGQDNINGALQDWLAAARISAESAVRSEGRAHTALYLAIGRAYDFAFEAESQAEAYAALLIGEGLTVQDRAPMTPIVKLVFGADYDKTRVTEYAAALSFARAQGVARGELAAWLVAFSGGLKGVVQAERAQRGGSERHDRSEQARAALRSAPVTAMVEMDAGDDEFVILIARREEKGRLAILSPLTDPALVEKAIRKAAS